MLARTQLRMQELVTWICCHVEAHEANEAQGCLAYIEEGARAECSRSQR